MASQSSDEEEEEVVTQRSNQEIREIAKNVLEQIESQLEGNPGNRTIDLSKKNYDYIKTYIMNNNAYNLNDADIIRVLRQIGFPFNTGGKSKCNSKRSKRKSKRSRRKNKRSRSKTFSFF